VLCLFLGHAGQRQSRRHKSPAGCGLIRSLVAPSFPLLRAESSTLLETTERQPIGDPIGPPHASLPGSVGPAERGAFANILKWVDEAVSRNSGDAIRRLVLSCLVGNTSSIPRRLAGNEREGRCRSIYRDSPTRRRHGPG
jgi:hypothetical protein